MKIERVQCSVCGKPVSNECAVCEELIVRAWVECPECVRTEPQKIREEEE